MKSFLIRVKGERDPWWTEVKSLLSGKGIRRESPEELAVSRALEKINSPQEIVGGSAKQIHISLSHDGEGRDRGVTVLAYDASTAGGPPRDTSPDAEIQRDASRFPRLRTFFSWCGNSPRISRTFGKVRQYCRFEIFS
ncbi:hypothetical protein SAMN05660653_02466 [Desulfonatronum thiosulfatophilum]|uniref:Uncharacterized protein n=1 Tax=Desulfonatronum thiosulfatophilum TaxID=617002 RepID=A0A1G6DZ67_9BACT|nr:hypothetical protein [Desulfonatronum thiosulfatophilum]SDB50045.1 hypothetical protein SAMN05660653_02466 [Desulfonatronum thiosulfatophilum]